MEVSLPNEGDSSLGSVWHDFIVLQVNNRIGVKRCSDGTVHIFINGEDMGVAASNVPKVRLGSFLKNSAQVIIARLRWFCLVIIGLLVPVHVKNSVTKKPSNFALKSGTL